MTEREKIIKGLEYCTEPGHNCNMSCPYYETDECEWVIKGDALALLKAQKPVEAAIGGNNYGGTWWYICPICNYKMDRYDNYCRHCGRAVKWE